MVITFPESNRRSVLLVSALALLIFVLGGAGGYMVRAISASAVASVPSRAAVRAPAPCASGSHAVVWYTAHAWGCASDAQGG